MVDQGLIHLKTAVRKRLPLSNQLAFVQKERWYFFTDTGAAAVNVITPTEPLANFVNHNSILHMGFTATDIPIFRKQSPLWKKQFPTLRRQSLSTARTKLGGKTSVEGPHGVPSFKTYSGTRMTLEALKRIKREIEAVNPDYVSKVDVKALVTLPIEHFKSKMRFVYDMPTVLLSIFCRRRRNSQANQQLWLQLFQFQF